MLFRSPGLKLDASAGPFRRALKYASYDWTREMSKPKRLITWAGMAFQGYAIYALLMWAWMVPNAGHNAPIVYCSGSTTFLQATGIPLGLFTAAEYQVGTAVIPPGGALLLFTDGLTDSISGKNPADRLRDALADNSGRTMATLEALVDPKLSEDDVTILLLKRATGSASSDMLPSHSVVQQAERKS
jgi:hypothetical protein